MPSSTCTTSSPVAGLRLWWHGVPRAWRHSRPVGSTSDSVDDDDKLSPPDGYSPYLFLTPPPPPPTASVSSSSASSSVSSASSSSSSSAIRTYSMAGATTSRLSAVRGAVAAATWPPRAP
uniref:Uncharacterized protein n=1 Tax=Arundo donax TaxID=35708 RepID=A0A0A9DS68_ARUDO